MPVRVLLADAYPVCLHGLRHVLAVDPEITIVGDARSGDDLIARAIALRPQVCVIDLDLEGMSGITALTRIRAADDAIRTVVVSARRGEWVDLAYDAGASAVLDKRQELEDLPEIVRLAAEGQIVPQARAASRQEPLAPVTLTPREIEVLALIVEGLSSRGIAKKIGTAVSTVEKHRESIRKKAHLHNTAEIVRFGFLYFTERRLREGGTPQAQPPRMPSEPA